MLFSSTRWHWANNFEGCNRQEFDSQGWAWFSTSLESPGRDQPPPHTLGITETSVWTDSVKPEAICSQLPILLEKVESTVLGRLHHGATSFRAYMRVSDKLQDRILLLGGAFHRKVGKAPTMVLGPNRLDSFRKTSGKTFRYVLLSWWLMGSPGISMKTSLGKTLVWFWWKLSEKTTVKWNCEWKHKGTSSHGSGLGLELRLGLGLGSGLGYRWCTILQNIRNLSKKSLKNIISPCPSVLIICNTETILKPT